MAYLLNQVVSAFDAAITQLTANLRWLSTQDHTTPAYVRAENCWANAWDLSCVAVWNSWGGSHGGPTAIHSRFAVTAYHFWSGAWTGKTIRFLDNEGTIVTRTVTDWRRIGTTDVAILELDEDLPATVSLAKILPATIPAYVSALGYGFPCLAVLQNFEDTYKRAACIDAARIVANSVGYIELRPSASTDSERASLYWQPKAGGSGSPILTIIDGAPVLLGTFAGASTCPALHDLISEIESAMTDMAGAARTVTQVSLAGVDKPAPDVTFYADKSVVLAGGSVTLAWSVRNAGTSISIDQEIGAVDPSDTLVVQVDEETTFTLTAVGDGGTTEAEVTIQVGIAPDVQFAATPASIRPGESATLSWSVTGASSVSINNGIGTVASTGSAVVRPERSTVYQLTATGAYTTNRATEIVVTDNSEDALMASTNAATAEVTSRYYGTALPSMTGTVPADTPTQIFSATTPTVVHIKASNFSTTADPTQVLVAITGQSTLSLENLDAFFGAEGFYLYLSVGQTITVTSPGATCSYTVPCYTPPENALNKWTETGAQGNFTTSLKTVSQTGDTNRIYSIEPPGVGGYRIRAGGFVFDAIPAGSQITGWKVEVYRYRGTTFATPTVKDRVIATHSAEWDSDNKANTVDNWPGPAASAAWATYGGDSDKWGVTNPVPADFNSTDFWVEIDVNKEFVYDEDAEGEAYNFAYLDTVRVTVYYTPPTVPDAPTIGSVQSSSGQVSVGFTAPENDGGLPISGYTATSSPGGITASGAASPIVFWNLVAGTNYKFTVHATNAVGDSAESAESEQVTGFYGNQAAARGLWF